MTHQTFACDLFDTSLCCPMSGLKNCKLNFICADCPYNISAIGLYGTDCSCTVPRPIDGAICTNGVYTLEECNINNAISNAPFVIDTILNVGINFTITSEVTFNITATKQGLIIVSGTLCLNSSLVINVNQLPTNMTVTLIKYEFLDPTCSNSLVSVTATSPPHSCYNVNPRLHNDPSTNQIYVVLQISGGCLSTGAIVGITLGVLGFALVTTFLLLLHPRIRKRILPHFCIDNC